MHTRFSYKLACEVNKISIKAEFFFMWVDSFIIWFKPNSDINNLTFEPSALQLPPADLSMYELLVDKRG